MSAVRSLTGDKQTYSEQAKMDAIDPISAMHRSRFLHRKLTFESHIASRHFLF
jgi:hypothetical protein